MATQPGARNRISLSGGRFVLDYSPSGLLGKGNFAAVYRGVVGKTGEQVAVKVISEADLRSRHGEVFKKAMELTHAELEVLKKSNHPNIVKYLGHENVPYNADTLHCYVLEFCPNDLDKFVKQQQIYTAMNDFVGTPNDLPLRKNTSYSFVDFTKDRKYILQDPSGRQGYVSPTLVRGAGLQGATAITLLKDMCNALHFMQSHGILHRDLKPENILVQIHIDGTVVFKVTDFGLAREAGKFDTYVGTEDFKAPEMFTRNVQFSHGVDVWAMGVSLFWCISDLYINFKPLFTTTQGNLSLDVTTFNADKFVKLFPARVRQQRAVIDAYSYALNLMLQQDESKRCNAQQLKTIVSRLSSPIILQSYATGLTTPIYIFPKTDQEITDTFKRKDLLVDLRRNLEIGAENVFIWSAAAGLISNDDSVVEFSQLISTNLLYVRGSELANALQAGSIDKAADAGQIRSYFDVVSDGFAVLKTLFAANLQEADETARSLMKLAITVQNQVQTMEKQLSQANILLEDRPELLSDIIAPSWNAFQADFQSLKQRFIDIGGEKARVDAQLLDLSSTFKNFSQFAPPNPKEIKSFLQNLQTSHFRLRSDIAQRVIKDNGQITAQEAAIAKGFSQGQMYIKSFVSSTLRCLNENQAVFYPTTSAAALLKSRLSVLSDDLKSWRAFSVDFWCRFIDEVQAEEPQPQVVVDKSEIERLQESLQVKEIEINKAKADLDRLNREVSELKTQQRKADAVAAELENTKALVPILRQEISEKTAQILAFEKSQKLANDAIVESLKSQLEDETKRSTELQSQLKKEVSTTVAAKREAEKLTEELKSVTNELDKLKSAPPVRQSAIGGGFARPSTIGGGGNPAANKQLLDSIRKKSEEQVRRISELETELENIKKQRLYDQKFAEAAEVSHLKQALDKTTKHWYRQHRVLAEIALLSGVGAETGLASCGCGLAQQPTQRCAEIDSTAILQALKTRMAPRQ